MKRERTLQVAVGLLGLFYVALIYPLYTDLAHSKWLLEMKNKCEPMFLSWFIALGHKRTDVIRGRVRLVSCPLPTS